MRGAVLLRVSRPSKTQRRQKLKLLAKSINPKALTAHPSTRRETQVQRQS